MEFGEVYSLTAFSSLFTDPFVATRQPSPIYALHPVLGCDDQVFATTRSAVFIIPVNKSLEGKVILGNATSVGR